MTMANDKTFRLDNITVKRMTDKALLVQLRNTEGKLVEEWLPRSQIKETDCLAEGDEGYVILTEWIAKRRNFLIENT